MKLKIGFVLIATALTSCGDKLTNGESTTPPISVVGTWQLISGMTIEKGDTVVTDYTKNVSFIKIINKTHFAFLQHDLTKGNDSVKVFTAGGGSYSLRDSLYTEHLDYCNDRKWEGNDFKFTIALKNDTLTQRGVEKIEAAGVDRVNVETYSRVKN